MPKYRHKPAKSEGEKVILIAKFSGVVFINIKGVSVPHARLKNVTPKGAAEPIRSILEVRLEKLEHLGLKPGQNVSFSAILTSDDRLLNPNTFKIHEAKNHV